jgi:CheY-like chemotaxis protein
VSFRIPPLAAAWVAFAAVAVGQPPAGEPRTPVDRFRAAREHYLDARYDVAAEELKGFLAANPADKDFFEIQRLYGPAVFERLRQVPRWSEEVSANAEAVKTIDEVVTRAREANKKFFRDPARIRQFVLNLGATTEERIYAEQQLRASGDAVVRPLLDEFRGTDDAAMRAGILSAIRRLGSDVVPGVLAGVESLADDKKLAVLQAVTNRDDLNSLAAATDTDPLPWLWYYSAAPVEQGALRAGTRVVLDQLVADAGRKAADAELVALARPAYDRKAAFATLDKVADTVTVWAWDEAAKELKSEARTKSQAEEFYGLRNLRWALERNPANGAAQDLYLGLATDRAVERTNYGPLFVADPGIYQLLAATPTKQLVRLLDAAITEKKPGEVMGYTQALADRADRNASTPTEVVQPNGTVIRKPPVLAKALDYPHPGVQLAAAIGLLRAPGPPLHGRQARVVEVLRRALAADPVPQGSAMKGKALLGDPSDLRGEKVASHLRAVGYAVERVTTGRDLLRRVARASDIDLIVLDRHLGGPMPQDVLASLKADANAARRPILLVASTDQTRPPPLELQLLRLAILVAVTETAEPVVPAPFFFDPRRPPVSDVAAARRETARQRDIALGEIAASRLARLRRLVQAADLPPNPKLFERLDLRLPELTYAVLATEYPVSEESAPELTRQLKSVTQRLRDRAELNPSVVGVPTGPLGRIIEEMDEAIDAPRRAKADGLRRRIDPAALFIPADNYRDRILEEQLARMSASTPGVTVVPEPFGLGGLAEEIQAATADPAMQPRDAAMKKVAARYAVAWLARIGLGDIPGYDVRPAEAELRAALRDDALVEDAIDALGRVPTAEVQQDLLAVALDPARPLDRRMEAADQTLRHVQSYGRSIPASQAATLADAAMKETGDLRGKLLVIHQLVSGKPDDQGTLFRTYRPLLAAPAAPVAADKVPDVPPKPQEPKN